MDISFILPCYNVGQYVEKCVESIVSQDFKDYEYEIICVDDCGTDNTLEILQRLCRENPHIKLVRNPKNGGLSFSRNRGIEAATGDWLWFVDTDDLITKDSVKNLLDIANSNECDLIVGRYYEFDENTEAEVCNKVIFRPNMPVTVGKNISHLPLNDKGNIGASVWCGIYKRSIYTENNISYNEKIFMLEDGMMNWELEQFNLTICRTEEFCYLYRYNPNSLSHWISPERRIRNYQSEIERICVYNRYYQEGKCTDVPKMQRLRDLAANTALGGLWKIPDMSFIKKEYKSIKKGDSILSQFPRRGKEKLIYSNILAFLTANLVYTKRKNKR